MEGSKILILGAEGQLGKQFQKELKLRGVKYIALDKIDCDITQFDNVNRIIDTISPELIINCAAYNSVDNAELNADLAYMVNYKAVENIAKICNRDGIFFVHYSTDYVFDGQKGDLYFEDDITNPLNVYGKSKLAGERAILDILTNYLIIRPSWVYGEGNQSFIVNLLKWASMSRVIKISSDQVSIPTSTYDIVQVTLDLIDKQKTGLFHVTNSNYCSRYEWSRFILEALNMNNIVIPVSIFTFESSAQRPLFTPMSNDKVCATLNNNIPDWRISMKEFLLHNFQNTKY